jgi:hypothetical protein
MAFRKGSTGKGMAGAPKGLEGRRKSRAARVERDTLDQADPSPAPELGTVGAGRPRHG